MTTFEIMQRIANNHNRIAQIYVSGDSAILLGDALRDMRLLVKELQEDLEREDVQESEEKDAG